MTLSSSTLPDNILAIDPGPGQSAMVVYMPHVGAFRMPMILDNQTLRARLHNWPIPNTFIACEMIASYGMAVGREVFETCTWIGRFEEIAEARDFEFRKIYRKDVKMHLCQSPRAKDANIRQALIDRFGQPGTKQNPGKLHGIVKHLWAAVAVAVYAGDVLEGELQRRTNDQR